MNRTATASWKATIKEGYGIVTTQSEAVNRARFSFDSRFNTAPGTNPEELMAGAHAACYTMTLNVDLSADGFAPVLLETICTISMVDGTINASHLLLKAVVPGLNDAQLFEYALKAKAKSPVSRAYNLDITLEATLINEPGA